MEVVRLFNRDLRFDIKENQVFASINPKIIKQNFMAIGGDEKSFKKLDFNQSYASQRGGHLLITFKFLESNQARYMQYYFYEGIDKEKLSPEIKNIYEEHFLKDTLTLEELLSNNNNNFIDREIIDMGNIENLKIN
jgi:hypothetical protein